MLSLQGIYHQYGDNPVLNDISFSVEEGEFACLVGESGCGKSTILRLIAGLDSISHGTITIDGEVVSSADTHLAPEKRGVGLVFQHPSLFPHMSVIDNVLFGLHGVSRKKALSMAEDTLSQVRYTGKLDAYPHQLSGGQNQRVALARALAPSPKILLLDEPFANLDSLLRKRVCADIFRLLKERGTTTIMVTHDPQEALNMADTIHLLKAGGEIRQSGKAEEVYYKPVDMEAAIFFGEANIMSAQQFIDIFGDVYRAEESATTADVTASSNLCCSVGRTNYLERIEKTYRDRKKSLDDARVMIRPESIFIRQICEGECCDGDVVVGYITSCCFYGMFYLVDVEVGEFTLKIADFSHRHFSKGDKVSLTLAGEEAVYCF